jgi:hypothetical protein
VLNENRKFGDYTSYYGLIMGACGSSLAPVPALMTAAATWSALRYSPTPATRKHVRLRVGSVPCAEAGDQGSRAAASRLAARADAGDLPEVG